MKWPLISIFFILPALFVSAQNESDSISQAADSNIYHISYDAKWLDAPDTSKIPVQTQNPQRYLDQQLHFNWLAVTGNIGGPVYPLWQEISTFNPLALYNNPLQDYAKAFHPNRRMIAHLPYTLLRFNTGPGKEQNLNVSHHQHVATRWYFGLDYRLIASPGNYQHEANQLHTVNLNLAYKSLDENYQALASFFHHKYNSDQNGGISDDTLYLDNTETDPGVIPVNLLSASSVNRNTGIHFHQHYRIFSQTKRDSINSKWLPSYLVHTLSYERFYRTFFDSDPLNEFYPTIYKDSSNTADSVGTSSLVNTFYLSNSLNANKQGIRYAFGIEYHDLEYYNGIAASDYKQLSSIVNFSLRTKRFSASAKLRQIIPSNDADGFSLKLNIGNAPDSSLRWYIGAHQQSIQPYLFQKSYYGNHYQWEMSYENQIETALKAGIEFKGINLSGKLLNKRNILVYDHHGLPVQYAKDLLSFSILAEKESQFGPFRNRTKAGWQSVSRELIQAVPEFLASTTIQLDIRPFRMGFSMRLGADITYLSSYYGQVYNPVTNQFQLQDEFKQGNHVFADAYLVLLIKRASVFFKFRDAANAIVGEGYYLTPDYPQSYNGFCFGVNWTFFD